MGASRPLNGNGVRTSFGSGLKTVSSRGKDHRLDVEHDSRAYGKGGAAERQAGVEEVANLLALNSEVLKHHAGDGSPHWGCDRY